MPKSKPANRAPKAPPPSPSLTGLGGGKTAHNVPQKRHLRYAPGSRKGAGNPHPHPPPVEHQFKLGNNANPGGRPKVLSSAYRKWLETINVNDPEGRTNAELVARSMGLQSLKGNINAAREMRSATEGDKLKIEGWEDIARKHGLDPEQVSAAVRQWREMMLAKTESTPEDKP